MTKDEYCKLKKIHFCNPQFNRKDEADEEFMHDIDEIVNLVRFKNKYKEQLKEQANE